MGSGHLIEPGCVRLQTRKNDIAMTNETSGGTDHREGHADYAWIVAQLAPGWRVIESRDGLQWIIQYSRRTKDGVRWNGHYHFRSKACLLRYVGELEGRGEFTARPEALSALAELPAWIETAGRKTKDRAEDRKAEEVAA